MPQRETVAGDNYDKSEISKITRKWGKILILYPLLKQSILLSSKTVFKFSTQFESTGLLNKF